MVLFWELSRCQPALWLLVKLEQKEAENWSDFLKLCREAGQGIHPESGPNPGEGMELSLMHFSPQFLWSYQVHLQSMDKYGHEYS